MEPKELAKLVANALRHDPESLSLELDPDGGWAEASDIAYGLELNTPHDAMTPDEVLEALGKANRGRFEIVGTRIRALKGHTTAEVSYEVCQPDALHAFISVSPRNLPYLLEHGLEPVKRRYTRLFGSYEDAAADAKKRRIKRPGVLRVDAEAAYNNQVVFYTHDGNLYAEEIPPGFLEEVES